MARFFYLLVLLVLVAAIAVFAYQNAAAVNAQFLNWGLSTPVAAVAGAAYLISVFRRSLYRVTEPRHEQR